jgi:hypothetical protein
VLTMRERAALKREVKLDNVRQDVERGSLVIRQMTSAERLLYPPRPVAPKRPGRR